MYLSDVGSLLFSSIEPPVVGMHIVIVPGNGCEEAAKANWYGWAQRKLNELPGVVCELKVSSQE